MRKLFGSPAVSGQYDRQPLPSPGRDNRPFEPSAPAYPDSPSSSTPGWAHGSAHAQPSVLPAVSQMGPGPYSTYDQPYPTAPPPFQIVASQGYGTHDYLAPPNPSLNDSFPSPQAPSGHYPLPPPARKPFYMVYPWLIPLGVVVTCCLLFIIEMAVNNCPHRYRASMGGQTCVARFLGRLSFQPFNENPLIGPSFQALVDTGGLEPGRVRNGQWWRLLTAMWLHAGLVHLAVNLVGIFYIGVPLQREYGPVRVGCIYLLSGISGAILSSLYLSDTVSVGASGALFGLIGSTLAELLAHWTEYTNQGSALISLLLLIAINICVGLMPYVDNFAHIGGLCAGFLLGFALLTKRGNCQRWVQGDPLRTMPPGGVIGPPPGNIMGGRNRGIRPTSKAHLVVRVVAGVLFLVGFGVGLIVLFSHKQLAESCSWCHYLNCIPTSLWTCPDGQSATNPAPICKVITYANGTGIMTCTDLSSTVFPTLGSLSNMSLRELCTTTCKSHT